MTAGALDGIRVLDLCIILAGPTCGRTLGEYGADVIKVDPENRKPGLTPWLDVGRGKRSVCLNVKKPAGLEAFYALADTADVVLTGFRKGVAERLGIGYEQLGARNPALVYAAINAFGRRGEWANRPGFDQNAQAAVGMQLRNGGADGEPAPPPYTFNDYGTGVMAAYGVILALMERERTGKGQLVDTSLAQTASTFSSAYMVDYEGFEPNEISGADAKGEGALSRMYRASDGWIALSADSAGDWERLAALEPFRAVSDERDEASLERAFAARPAAEWLEMLSGAGIAAAQCRTLDDVRSDADARARGMIVSSRHPAYGGVEHGGVAQRLSATPARVGATPVFGGDTESVLAELGYAPARIAQMRADGVIPAAGGVAIR